MAGRNPGHFIWLSGAARPRRQHGFTNRLDMTMIGAAAAAEHPHRRERAPELAVAAAEIARVARIKRGGLVEFGMAPGRGVGPHTMDAPGPGFTRLQRVLEMHRMRAVDHEL